MFRILGLAILCCSIASVSLYASTKCKDEVNKFCSGLEEKPSKLKKCIQDNKDKIPKECRDQVDQLKAQILTGIEGCKKDVEKFCNSDDGLSKMKKCLKAKYKELSGVCKAQMSLMP